MIASECEVVKVVRAGHPNVLIVGSDRGAEEVIDRLRPCFSPPLHTCNLPGRLTLPAEASGTLLLRHVTELVREQQDQLLDWLDKHGATIQVISVSATPLFPCVERGTFDTRLYYRLNTVLDDVDACCLNTMRN